MSIILVTGANKGLGYAAAEHLIGQGHTVYLGARDKALGEAAAARLGGRFVYLDVTDDAIVGAALHAIGEQEGRLDTLVNNAGIGDAPADPLDIRTDRALQVFDTNVVGTIRVTQVALPLLRKSDNPVIVNVSSGLGSFWAVTDPDRDESHMPFVVYGASKSAISMLTVQYAKALPDMKVNAVEPGVTSTDLTGHRMGGSASDNAQIIARIATMGPDGPTGTFQSRDGVFHW